MPSSQTIEVSDMSLTIRPIHAHDETPTGAQLALLAGFRPNQSVIVLQLLDNGQIEEIRPEELASLARGHRFVIDESDRLYRLKINGLTIDWLARWITGYQVRVLGRIDANEELLLVKVDTPDQPVGDHEKVDLEGRGAEEFVSRKPIWKLKVQTVVKDYHAPLVKVRDALSNAGFDPDAGWIIHLKVQGQPNRKVELDDTVDLRTPGIEKIRLTPKDVTNGEAPNVPRRQFALLPVDVEFLDGLGLTWEAVIDGQKRWLLIHNYALPAGYTVPKVTIALWIPDTYPAAQIDMFYVFPPIRLVSGREIPRILPKYATICEQKFDGWSRHRSGASIWNPNRDNVQTQMALVDGALHKEIGE